MRPISHHAAPSGQHEVVAFLGAPETWSAAAGTVERIETHGAIVFLAGEFAYKIKKAVRFTYMDFSTLEQRRRACAREIEVNQAHAPDLYLGVVPITRRADGGLELGGKGEPVEWAVHMRRFPKDALLSDLVARGELDAGLARQIADAIFDYHRNAAVVRSNLVVARLQEIAGQVVQAMRHEGLGADPIQSAELEALCNRQLARCATILERRERAGCVRRCHGDLHLANIVMWNGRPTLFDAIEFDEAIAEIDTLYDLAFVLMDLDARQHRASANLVLNRYLWRSQDLLDLEGLAALPLFLGLRAAVRAMVEAQRAGQRASPAGDQGQVASQRYLRLALAYLDPSVGNTGAPRLIAVGGLSGTGKSTLAAALAPLVGLAPGAVHLRSDLERKAMFGVGETDRLPDECYTPDVGHRVYERLVEKARTILSTGHSVVVDAVFLSPDERRGLEHCASAASARFQGIWLAAPLDALLARVAARTGDASDATSDVVRRQNSWTHEPVKWPLIDASRNRDEVRNDACRLLGTN